MPSKIQLDENLWFLYICLQKSDMKSIDFTAVGTATSLKPPAARMRYTRLRRQIESGTLIGTHGTPFASPTVPEDEHKIKGVLKSTKRKRALKKEHHDQPNSTNSPTTTVMTNTTEETKIKTEDLSSSYSSSYSGSSDEESEDEMPLAKLSKKNHSTTFPLTSLPFREQETGMSNGRENEEREQAELQALIPVGRAEFGSQGTWIDGRRVVEEGNWYERYLAHGGLGENEGKERISV